MLRDEVLATIVRRFFGVGDDASVRLTHNRDEETVTGLVGGATCILEPRPVLPCDEVAAMLDLPGASPPERDWNVGLVGIRVPGGPSSAPRALDAGFAAFSEGEIVRLSRGAADEDLTAGLARYWQRIAAGADGEEPVALAHAMVLFARPDLGVQNLVVARHDVASWLHDETLASVRGFSELQFTRGPSPELDLHFCSYELRMPEISLFRWHVEVSASGALRYGVAPIAERLAVQFTPMSVLARRRRGA